MQKAITYSSFLIASFVVTALFITSSDYTQLAIAVTLYPFLIYIAYELFVRTKNLTPPPAPQVTRVNEVQVAPVETVKETSTISDIEKRAFLKLVGAAGISFFLFSLFNKKLNPLSIGGNSLGSGTLFGPDNVDGTKTEAMSTQPLDGYKISEIDDIEEVSYYGFINKDGGWLIMRQDADTSTFRYTKGDSDFPKNWEKRGQFMYDYFYNVF